MSHIMMKQEKGLGFTLMRINSIATYGGSFQQGITKEVHRIYEGSESRQAGNSTAVPRIYGKMLFKGCAKKLLANLLPAPSPAQDLPG